MPVIVYCSNCGKEIRRTPALVKKNRTGRFFCNQDCTNAWWEKNGGYANTARPGCGSHDVTQISRVTGYLQEVSGWNAGKQQELKDRQRYDATTGEQVMK